VPQHHRYDRGGRDAKNKKPADRSAGCLFTELPETPHRSGGVEIGEADIALRHVLDHQPVAIAEVENDIFADLLDIERAEIRLVGHFAGRNPIDAVLEIAPDVAVIAFFEGECVAAEQEILPPLRCNSSTSAPSV